jgi:hypothetical protein
VAVPVKEYSPTFEGRYGELFVGNAPPLNFSQQELIVEKSMPSEYPSLHLPITTQKARVLFPKG